MLEENQIPLKPRSRFPLVAGTALATTVVAASAFYFGISSINNPTLPANSNAAAVAPVDLKIKGNRVSKIYHLRGCPNYDDIKEIHIVWFKTTDAAEASGYRMARNC